MGNLIKNPCWLPDASGRPAFFTFEGPFVYDELPIGEYRTCSLSLCEDEQAEIRYDPGIYLSNKRIITLSYMIRAIQADRVQYVICFCDSLGQQTGRCRLDVTSRIGRNFRRIGERVPIPEGSCFARLSLYILGRTTAMTLYSPSAVLLRS